MVGSMTMRYSLLLGFVLPCVAGCGAAMSGGGGGDSQTHPMVGVHAPEFTKANVGGGGDKLSVGDAKGKVLVVDFWATYCEPCKKSFPKLQTLADRYKSDLVVYAVSEDDEKDEIPSFLKRTGVHFPVAWDEGQALGHEYQVQAMPSTYVIDRRGVVRFVHRGFHEGDDQNLENEIKELMQ
jgi:cytochrome c biogenesis protein CcmG/thiol:disulfide interchange protein DsbE